MIGTTISHYKILEKLGSGGMGVVYRAEDSRLKRIVALKFLPPDLTRDPEAKQRFTHEAQAASALQHNNICAVHDIDETPDGRIFIVMDCYEGESLKEKIGRGPIAVEEAVRFATQVATGLGKAHQKGIVHRDIKPANILITTDGIAKIVDFGLAKLSGRSLLTKTGSTLGTVAYMSPEQARSEEVDARTDIWSLGVVLYEMLTGRKPFKSDYEQALVYAILNEEPAPLTSVPQALAEIVSKCLRKDPVQRYQHADDVAQDLQNLMGTGSRALPATRWRTVRRSVQWRPIVAVAGVLTIVLLAVPGMWLNRSRPQESEPKSIAVLPFVAMGTGGDARMFADGIHGEILNRLTKIEGLRVKAQTSVLQYRDTKKTIHEIAQELGVDFVMEGSVQQASGRVMLQAQLIDGSSQEHVWAETYDRQLADIFLIERELAEKIAGALHATLTQKERALLAKIPTRNNDAHGFFVKGNMTWNRSTDIITSYEALELYEKAVALDPEFALAYVMLCEVHSTLYWYEHYANPDRIVEARKALDRATAIDPELPELHRARAVYFYWVEKDTAMAFKECAEAVSGAPNNSDLLLEMGFLMLESQKMRKGLEILKRGYELDPDEAFAVWISAGYANLREWDEVERWNDLLVDRAPKDIGGYAMQVYAAVVGRGDFAKGRMILNELVQKTNQRYGRFEYLLQLWTRDFEGALCSLDADSSLSSLGLYWYPGSSTLEKALLLRRMGRLRQADSCAREAEKIIVRLVDEAPRWRYNRIDLARCLVILGRREEARKHLEVAMRPGFEPHNGPSTMMYELGVVYLYIELGEIDQALNMLEHLISIPSILTKNILLWDPVYDPLRDNPRFQTLLAVAK